MDMQGISRRVVPPMCCLPADNPQRDPTVRPLVRAPASTKCNTGDTLVADNALYQPIELPPGGSPGLLLYPQQSQLACSSAAQHTKNQQRAAPAQEQWLQQGSTAWQSSQATWPQQLHARPVYLPGQLQQLVSVLQGCSDLEQLRSVVSANLSVIPPSCLVVAMQQTMVLQRGHRQQLLMSSQQTKAELVAGLSYAMVQQLSAASCEALTEFIAAAAAGQLLLPCTALEQMSAELVHRALRAACQQRQQEQQRSANIRVTRNHCNSSGPGNSSDGVGRAQQPPASGRVLQCGVHCGQQMPFAENSDPFALRPQQQQQQQHPIARSAWALAKLGLRHPAVWIELSSLAGEYLEQLSAPDCVLLSWALAKSQHHSQRLFNALQHRLRGDVQQLSPDAISCLLWSYAAVGHYHHAGTTALVTAAAGSMERFQPRALTRTLWACAKLRHFDPRLLSALRVKALASMKDFEPQSLSTLMWGLASFSVKDRQLMRAVAQQALVVMTGFSIQGLANLAWGAAKIHQHQWQKHQPGTCAKQPNSSTAQPDIHTQLQQQLICSISSAAVPLLPSAKPQEVCNLLWACAVMHHRDQQFLTAACSRLVCVAGDACPHDLAQAMWALHLLKHRNKHTQQVLARQALNKLHLFGPQALSNWSWAAAAAGIRLPACTQAAVAQQCQVLLPQFTPQGLATTLWALSKMGRVPQQLLHEASQYILGNITCYNAHDICNTSMVCAKAGYREPALLQGLANAASSAAAATLMLHSHSSNLSRNSSREVTAAALAALGHVSESQQSAVISRSDVGPQPGQQVMLALSGVLQQKQLTPQGVCNLIWAFAGMGWHDPVLMQQLQQLAAMAVLDGNLKAENVAGLVQGLALLGESCGAVFVALEQCRVLGLDPARRQPASARSGATGRLKQTGLRIGGSSTSIDSTSSSASQQQQQQQQQPAVKRWRRQLRTWPADALALLAWGGITGGAADHSPSLLLVVLQELSAAGAFCLSERRRAQLHLALTLLATRWGVVSWGSDGGLAWAQTSTCGCSSSSTTTTTSISRDLGSAHCCSSIDEAAAGAAPAQSNRLPAGVSRAAAAAVLCGPMARHCATAWRHEEAAAVLSSTEEEVLQVLQSLGLKPMAQRWIQPAQHCQGSGGTAAAGAAAAAAATAGWSSHGLRVCIGVTGDVLGPGHQPVAVEVLSARSVSSSWPVKVVGLRALQQQCLRAAGWRVVVVTADEWDSLGGQRTAQQHLLRQLLHVRHSVD